MSHTGSVEAVPTPGKHFCLRKGAVPHSQKQLLVVEALNSDRPTQTYNQLLTALQLCTQLDQIFR